MVLGFAKDTKVKPLENVEGVVKQNQNTQYAGELLKG